MSFAAVTSLVAVAEWEQRRERAAPRGTLYRYWHGIVTASLVGSLATLPFAIFHFDRAALSVVAMPFGLEVGPLHLLGWGIGVMLAMGRWVSGLPGAVWIAPVFPVSALALLSLGGLWIAIWQRGCRGPIFWWRPMRAASPSGGMTDSFIFRACRRTAMTPRCGSSAMATGVIGQRRLDQRIATGWAVSQRKMAW
jgi:hypothetical protein